ncbi:MAG: FG-GAP repeat protein [Phycisphaerae bacterium]|nr:FG-GAP repeat protein [Phycisphaerae bacterium]
MPSLRTAHSLTLTLFVASLPLLFAETGSAQTKLLATNVAPYDISGFAVAVSGNIAVLGAPLDDTNGSASGSAAVFRWNGTAWIQEATLLAADGSADDRFGGAVSIDGDLIAVSSLFEDGAATDAGAVYLFRFNGSIWAPEAKLVAPDAGSFDQFGWSISVEQDRLLVGARHDDDGGLDAGSAYVFHRLESGWQFEAKLSAFDGGPYDLFGASVALSGNRAVIGAPNDDLYGWGSGSAYVFRRSSRGWISDAKLKATDQSWSAEFGQAVDIDGGTIVIGAWGDDEGGPDAGAAYVFREEDGVWAEEQKLLSDDGVAGDLFGCSVSVRGHNILVGAPLASATGPASGAAVRFHKQGVAWNQQETLTAATNDSLFGFGYSVCIDDSAYLVGVPYDNDAGSEAGGAYVFTFLEPLFADLNADGSVNQLDLGILLGTWGVLGGPADLDADGIVGPADLALMLGAWTWK